jgi:hypothetical protein
MKKLLTLIGAAVILNCAIPADAFAARVVRRVVDRCDYCRQPVYAQRYIAGHTRRGYPIYRWRVLSHQHRRHYSRPYVYDRYDYDRPSDYGSSWSRREPDIYARDRYDARWRERRYYSSPEYLRLPGLALRVDER